MNLPRTLVLSLHKATTYYYYCCFYDHSFFPMSLWWIIATVVIFIMVVTGVINCCSPWVLGLHSSPRLHLMASPDPTTGGSSRADTPLLVLFSRAAQGAFNRCRGGAKKAEVEGLPFSVSHPAPPTPAQQRCKVSYSFGVCFLCSFLPWSDWDK